MKSEISNFNSENILFYEILLLIIWV